MTDLHPDVLIQAETATQPGLHILVVENPQSLPSLVAESLTRMGCVITLAHSYDEALQRWDEHSHDLLITPVSLADKDGYQLAAALRHQGSSTPIIGLITQQAEHTRCLHAGMNASLISPLNPNALYRLLHQLASASIPKRYRAIFQHTMRTDLALLEHALQDTHYENAQLILHRMAGALVVMGMQNLSDTSLQLKALLDQHADEPHTVQTHARALCTALRNVIDQT